MNRRVVGAVAAVGSVLGLLAAVPARASSPAPPACITLAVSPNFARDGTAACARLVISPTSQLTVDITTNRGRSWSLVPATGLTWSATAQFVAQPMFSPNFASDHRIFIATDLGLFVSTDLGKTFTAADTAIHAASTVGPTLYAGGAGGLAALWPGQRLFAVGLGTPSRRLDVASGVDMPILGSPDQQIEQIVGPNSNAPTAPIYALSQTSATGGQSGLWTCDDNLACSTQLSTFSGQKPFRMWEAPMPRGGYAIFVYALNNADSSSHLLRSTDGGKTFKPVAQVDSLFKLIDDREVAPQIGLAVNAKYPGRILLRVEGFPAGKRRAGDPPAEQIFRSDDGGATWRSIGYQWGIMQAAPTGPLPFNMMSYGYASGTAPIELTNDGHLLVPAQLEEYTKTGLVDLDGVYCSVDFGHSWHRTCPR